MITMYKIGEVQNDSSWVKIQVHWFLISWFHTCWHIQTPQISFKQNDWLQKIGWPIWTPKAGSRLCSIHFEEDRFTLPLMSECVWRRRLCPPSSPSQKTGRWKERKRGPVSKLPVKTRDQVCQTDAYVADHTYCCQAGHPLSKDDGLNAGWSASLGNW